MYSILKRPDKTNSSKITLHYTKCQENVTNIILLCQSKTQLIYIGLLYNYFFLTFCSKFRNCCHMNYIKSYLIAVMK
jgi:hypothetical protein